MFDFSFYEMLVFGIIALIVLGPEKLPQAVRTVGTYYSKFRRTVGTLKAEMEAELDLAETRQLMQKELEKIRLAEAEMQKEMDELRGSMKEFEQQKSQLQQTLNSASFASSTDTSVEVEASSTLSDSNQNIAEKATSKQKASERLEKPWVHPVTNATTMGQSHSDYAYAPSAATAYIDPQDLDSSQANITDTDTDTDTAAQQNQLPLTRPWENMWFLLGDYDRARRLPPAPFVPDYKAIPLLYDTAAGQSTKVGP